MELLVSGSANGESLVLVLEDWVCVVDSHRVKGSNPVVKYLDQNEVLKIDLLVITHPHFDHYEGVDDYEKYQIGKLLLFPDLGLTQQKKMLRLWIEESQNNQLSANSLVQTENDNLTKLMKVISKWRSKLGRNFEIVSQAMPIKVNHSEIIVEAVGPFSYIYSEEMDKLTQKAFNNSLTLKDAAKADNYNSLSICLSITWREFKVLLLADATDKTLSEIQQITNLGPYDLVKVAHHGSVNGNPLSFWKFISSQGKATKAVVTHHGRHKLPQDSVLDMIRDEVNSCGGSLHLVDFDKIAPRGILFKFDNINQKVTSSPWK